MEWYEQWAHEAYIDETDVLLHLPNCSDRDCLIDPYSCLRSCVAEFDYSTATKQTIGGLNLTRCIPTHCDRLYSYVGRKKESDPDGYVRLALMVRAVQMHILRPFRASLYEDEDPQPPAILYQGGNVNGPIAMKVVLDGLIPPAVCGCCGNEIISSRVHRP